MFKCNICNREFKSIMAVSGHKRAHSPKTKIGKDIEKSKLRAKLKREKNEIEYQKSKAVCKSCKISLPYDSYLKRKHDRNYRAYKNIFCSQSCAASFNNLNKTKGTRRSKLEAYIEQELKKIYPELEIHFNSKEAINSELDIFLPSKKLAFELNGIFHYEPIHGENILRNIKNNDNRKFQACLEKGIELCIIDSSKLKYFKEENAKPYLKIVTDIIDLKIHQRLGSNQVQPGNNRSAQPCAFAVW